MVQNRALYPQERFGYARSFIEPHSVPVEDVYRNGFLFEHTLKRFDHSNEKFGQCYIYMPQNTEVVIRTALDFSQKEIRENFLNPEEKPIFNSDEVWCIGHTLYCNALRARENGKRFFVALTIKKADRLRQDLVYAKIPAVVTSYEEKALHRQQDRN